MEMMYDEGIHPIIDTRSLWKDEKIRPVFEGHHDIYYNECGDVYCFEPENGTRHLMCHKNRELLISLTNEYFFYLISKCKGFIVGGSLSIIKKKYSQPISSFYKNVFTNNQRNGKMINRTKVLCALGYCTTL